MRKLQLFDQPTACHPFWRFSLASRLVPSNGAVAGRHGAVAMPFLTRAVSASRAVRVAVAIAVLAWTGVSRADEATKIRFTLDWKIQGSHAWYYLAKDKGY